MDVIVIGDKTRFAIQLSGVRISTEVTWGDCGFWFNNCLVSDRAGEIGLDYFHRCLTGIANSREFLTGLPDVVPKSAQELSDLVDGPDAQEFWYQRLVFEIEGFDSFIIIHMPLKEEVVFFWAFNPYYSDYEEYKGLYPDTVDKVVIPRSEFNSIIDEFTRFLLSTKPGGRLLF